MTTEAAIEAVVTENVVTDAPPPAAEAPKPAPTPPKRTASKPVAQEPHTRMSDEANKPAPASIPVEIVQQLAQFEAMKAENAKMVAEREAFVKAQEELKTAATKVQEQFTQTEAQVKALAEANRSMKITNAVRLAAMEAGAIDPDDVTTLLSGRFTIAEDGLTVITADDTKAKAVDAVKSFLEKKPHLAGRKVAGGSGASPFPAQTAPTSKPFDFSTREGATAYVDSLLAAGNPPKK